ncbi:TlpA family protein disulfide reductase [Sphingobacterium thalpophilum]|uniref:TlpA family protein disulfide reductase n=1 Tax=Sphingobacterium thalpophilum TaxID=259 RepID=UPI0037DA291F
MNSKKRKFFPAFRPMIFTKTEYHTRPYKVNGIPRYLLIDKAGNLISADSPRPSDPKLKVLLEEWLKK